MRESGIVLTQPRGSSFIGAAEADADAYADADADGGEATGQQNKRYTNTEAYARFSVISDFSQFFDRLKADVAADDTVCVNQSMRFYDIPLQLQLWGSPVMDVQIKWNTYFFDLFFVAAAFNLGHLLMSGLNEDDYDDTLLYVIGIYGGIYDIFLRASLYDSQFSSSDYVHRIIELLRIFCLSMVVAYIGPIERMTDPTYKNTFMMTLWFFLELLIRIALELELYFFTKGDRIAIKNQSKRHLLMEILPVSVFYLAATIIARVLHTEQYDNLVDVLDDLDDTDSGHTTGNTTVVEEHRFLSSVHITELEWDVYWNHKGNLPIIFLVFGVLYSHLAMGVISWVLSPKPNIRSLLVPMNIDFLIHRFGEFNMIFFGEAIMGLLIVNTAEHFYYRIQLCLGVLSVMILQNFKYESEPHGEKHYLWGGGLRALCVYSFLTELLCLFMVGLAISYKSWLILVAEEWDDNIELFEEEVAGSPEQEAELEESFGTERRLNAGGPEMTFYASETLYSISLAVVLLIIVVMSYSHIGFKKMIFPIRHGRLHYSSLLRLIIQLGLIIFVGTMHFWVIKKTEGNDLDGKIWIDQPQYFFKNIIGFVVILIFAGFKTVENLMATKNTTNSNNDDDVGSPSLTNENDDDLQSSTEASKRKDDDNNDSADDNRSLNDLEQEQKDLLQRAELISQRAEHIAHLIDIRKDSTRVEEQYRHNGHKSIEVRD